MYTVDETASCPRTRFSEAVTTVLYYSFEKKKRNTLISTKNSLRCPLKGQSDAIFESQFFSSFKLAWATDQWVFRFWFRFRRDIRIFPNLRAE